MLKNQWYAVEFGHAVKDKPVQAKMFGHEFVLWRDSSGAIQAQSDLCVHRGAPLSGGKVVGSCIECPYHGWRFDRAGVCTAIPANRPDLPIPKKARVDTYPVVERYGFIFVFLGDLPEAERPPVPELELLEPVPEARAAGCAVVFGEFHWNANYERILENAVDISHTPFVHAGSFGNPDKPMIEDFDVIEDRAGEHLKSITATVHLEAPPAKGIWSLLSRGKERKPIKTRAGVFLPNITMLEVNSPVGLIKIHTAAVAVDEHHTISKWIMVRDFFTGKWADKNSWNRTQKIFYEDQATVEGQRPELVPFDIAAELHVKSDALQLTYRRWRQACLDRGWGIEPRPNDTPEDRRTYYVIPSPARREHPELANAWVLKELPSNGAHRDHDVTLTDQTPAPDDAPSPSRGVPT